MSASRFQPRGPVGRFVHNFEETAIAVLLAAMALVTFANVVLRYVFTDSLLWGLETTVILFAWLVMFGVSYAFKVTAHLGVDAITSMLPKPGQRVLAILAGVVCVAYAYLLLKGGWDFWANFGNLPQTEGRVFPTGFQEMRPQDFRGYIETQQVPFPEMFRGLLEGWLLLEGDPAMEKLPRAIPYVIMPLGAALLLFRVIQATVWVIRGQRESLIVSHEAEEAVEDAARNLEERGV